MNAAFVQVWARGVLGFGPRLRPGGLALGADVERGDGEFVLDRARRHGPIFTFRAANRLAIGVTGFDTIRRLLRDHQADLGYLTYDLPLLMPGGILRAMTGEQHQRYRALFAAALYADLLQQREADLFGIAQEALAAMAAALAEGTAPQAALATALERFALRGLLLLMVGLLQADPRFAALDQGLRMIWPDGPSMHVGRQQQAGFAAVRAVLDPLAAALARGEVPEASDAVLPRLIAAGGDPTDATLLGNLVMMLELGRTDMRCLLAWALKYFGEDPGTVAELSRLAAAGPGQAAALRALSEACVQETLRLDQAEALMRVVTRSFTFEGHRFPAGARLRLLLRESHRDPALFEAAESFRPARFLPPAHPEAAYRPFGVGAQFAIRLSALVLETLAAGFDWRVLADGPRHRGIHHCQPSPDFAIGLARRG
jgi:cytochrome P450